MLIPYLRDACAKQDDTSGQDDNRLTVFVSYSAGRPTVKPLMPGSVIRESACADSLLKGCVCSHT